MSAETLMARMAGSVLPRVLVFAAGLVAWLLSFLWTEPAAAWRALLIGFLYFTPLTGGLVAWIAMIRAADGEWALAHEEMAADGIAFFLPSLIALLALWAASPVWAPWYGKNLPQGFWLDNTFLFGRQLAALLVFWAFGLFYLRRRQGESGRRTAAVFLFVFCLVFTLIAFDLVMALDPHWYSSLFGGYFFISALYLAIACWGLIAAVHPATDAEFRRTVGTLLLSFNILTTYMMFCQLLPIWYENLPHETRFLYDRLHTPSTRLVTWFLLAAVWVGPLAMLLTRKSRQDRRLLGLISAVILVAMWVERWWMVAPTFTPDPVPGVAELGIVLAFAGAWGTAVTIRRRRLAAGRPS